MKYFVFDFKIDAADEMLQVVRDVLTSIVVEAGFESFEDTTNGTKGYVQMDLLDQPMLDSLLADFPMEEVKIEYEMAEAADENWNEKWEEEGFYPIAVEPNVIIYDAHHPERLQVGSDDTRLKVGIEARQAFGTGTHETTRMIVSALQQFELSGKRILDCGSGTGILAITALLLGADEAVGYDIDEWSVDNSLHNAKLNGVEQKISVLHGDASVLSHVSGMFDVVMANINRNILLADMSTMHETMNAGAVLLLSGFYSEDIPLLRGHAAELGLHEIMCQNDGDWAMLGFSN